jgi:hypothetical protein
MTLFPAKPLPRIGYNELPRRKRTGYLSRIFSLFRAASGGVLNPSFAISNHIAQQLHPVDPQLVADFSGNSKVLACAKLGGKSMAGN